VEQWLPDKRTTKRARFMTIERVQVRLALQSLDLQGREKKGSGRRKESQPLVATRNAKVWKRSLKQERKDPVLLLRELWRKGKVNGKGRAKEKICGNIGSYLGSRGNI